MSITKMGANTPRDTWYVNLQVESDYWDAWLESKGAAWALDPVAARAEFDARFDPATPLQDELRALIADDAEDVSILDVGAGPATVVGKVWPGRRVTVAPIDPLAHRYGALLHKHKVWPPLVTQYAEAETLPYTYQRFDLTYARNSLDHCYDPRAAVMQMYRVTKPGGVVYLLHHDNEANRRNGEGLHRWNFYPRHDGYMIEPLGGECSPLNLPNMTMRRIGRDETEVIIRKPHD